MLELKEIKKVYKVGDIETVALDGISLSFRQKEFVAILGPSGSGKTTCLNVIGGLDRYDSGNMIINGKETKNFSAYEWDAYRNNSIGFVFQSYNLISHLSIVANVEMSMTLSGVSASQKKRRALEVLEQVGLKEHIHKKPNQLSGGQMQRVAIARALANNPDILLCDEPTGALDTNTSIQIMELIKEVSKDKLVVMVTHNPEIAERYADRIIKFKDGRIEEDSKPHIEKPKSDIFKLKRTSMSFFTALKLSFNNIRTKKGRTLLTSFASSIGIIGIALILSLSVGFQEQINEFQSAALSEFPVMVTKQAISIEDHMKDVDKGSKYEEYPDDEVVYLYDTKANTRFHINKFTEQYMSYVDNIDSSICKSISYARATNFNLFTMKNENALPVTSDSVTISPYPELLDEQSTKESYLDSNYDLLSGNYPANKYEMLLVVDKENRLDINAAAALGINTENIESIGFDAFIGKELRIVNNNNYYLKIDDSTFTLNTDYNDIYYSEDNIKVKIVGIIRAKEDAKLAMLSAGVVYSDKLVEEIVEKNKNSDIVLAQKASTKNVLTREEIDEDTKNTMITYLGGNTIPYMITIYPYDFDTQEEICDYLDVYNEGKAEEDKVMYTDLADTITSLTGDIMDGITMVLIAFAATSLVVSLIMISIITYTSVLERTKEIGVLRALGARKKDITRVFNAETFIIGIASGLLGIGIAMLLTIPINSIIYDATGLVDVAYLKLSHAVVLVAISTILTVLGGYIPAKMASKKDAVAALRAD